MCSPPNVQSPSLTICPPHPLLPPPSPLWSPPCCCLGQPFLPAPLLGTAVSLLSVSPFTPSDGGFISGSTDVHTWSWEPRPMVARSCKMLTLKPHRSTPDPDLGPGHAWGATATPPVPTEKQERLPSPGAASSKELLCRVNSRRGDHREDDHTAEGRLQRCSASPPAAGAPSRCSQ